MSTPPTPSPGVVRSWPNHLLRLEGLTLFSASIWAYSRTGLPWWYLAAGLLVPDLGMVGFLSDNVTGAAIYNAAHTETPAILLMGAGLARQSRGLMGVGLVWLAHINMDRMLTFGLKYGTGFGHTHLGIMGEK